MIIRALLIAYILLLLHPSITAGYDDQVTHPEITGKAVSDVSNLNVYLKTSLGLEKGIDSRFPSNSQDPKTSALELLKAGSTAEDSPACRASNHFHDPLKPWNESYMSDDLRGAAYLIRLKCNVDGWSYSNRQSDITWATGYLSPPPDGQKQTFTSNLDRSPINWDKARDYYYKALTSTTNLQPPSPPGRDYYFANAFQSLGNVLHLLQDMAVPAHVRNDFTSHIAFNGVTSSEFVRWFGNHYEYYVQNHQETITSQTAQLPSFTNTRLTDFWDTDQYTGIAPLNDNSIGLAEFTNANYLSDSTIPYTLRMPYHMYTYPKIDNPNIQICKDYEPGSTKKRVYLSRKDRGACPPITEARAADHFAALGFWNDLSVNTIINSVLNLDLTVLATPVSLDDNVHKTYAKDILPRAVGYSAGLLDYFFRGSIEISAPEKYAYAITDGSLTPYFDSAHSTLHQQFTKITAKVQNITLNEAMTAGILQAVARYKILPNYSPNLSNYPPDGTVMHNVAYSYSVSSSMTLLSEQLASINMYPSEIVFDFNASPIPAGITDLSLQVIFKGTLGNETNTAVAVGMKDLKEPTHHIFWNLTDMFSLYGHLYTAEQIRADSDLLQQASGAYIDPYPMNFEIAFMPNSPPEGSPVVSASVTNLPPGRSIRLITLIDDELTENYVRVVYTNNIDSDNGIFDFLFDGVVNQEADGVWQQPTPVNVFRSASGHLSQGVLRCKPYSVDPVTGQHVCAYPEAEAKPANLTPYPVVITP